MAIIFHIDVNSAYLSWTAAEELKNGQERDIRLIPSIIGGNQSSRHGIVLAKSVPAKKYGIRTGEPVANAIRKCPNLLVVPPAHELYHRYSSKFIHYLKSYTTDIEQVSIDECYMDYTKLAPNYSMPEKAAEKIKNEIQNKFGFTVNIGISTNKLLAKMASDFEKPNRVHTLYPEEIKQKMWPLPVENLYMAGTSSVKVLKKLGISTIGDLAGTDPEILELHLKKHGRMLWESANGRGDDRVVSKKAKARGIGHSVTFSKDLVSKNEAEKELRKIAARVGERLRKSNQKAGMFSVEIKYYNFESASHQKQLIRPVDSDAEIHKESMKLFEELWTGEPIRLLGIRGAKLSMKDEPVQMTLFDLKEFTKDDKENEKKKKLEQALHQIRCKFGENAVMKGSLLNQSITKDMEEKKHDSK